MNLRIVVPMVAAFAIAASLPASACDNNKSSSATTASAGAHGCAGVSRSTAWSGAWLQRSAGGGLTVLAVAKGSPAARSGLRKGDVVLAVNGRELSAESGHMCADGSTCAIGSSFAYTVQRGRDTRTYKVKLEKMPKEATMRFADVEPTFEPRFAAVVIPTVD